MSDKDLLNPLKLEQNKKEFGTALGSWRGKKIEEIPTSTEIVSGSMTVIPFTEERRESSDAVPSQEVSDDSFASALEISEEVDQSHGSLKAKSTELAPSPYHLELAEHIKKLSPDELKSLGKSVLTEYYRALKQVSRYLLGFQRDDKKIEANRMKLALGLVVSELQKRNDVTDQDMEASDFAPILIDQIEKAKKECMLLKTTITESQKTTVGLPLDKIQALDVAVGKLRDELNKLEELKKRNQISLGHHTQAILQFRIDLEMLDSFLKTKEASIVKKEQQAA